MRSRQLPIWIFLAIVAIAIPLSGNGYYLSVGTTVLIFAVLAVGLNVVLGYAGLLEYREDGLNNDALYLCFRCRAPSAISMTIQATNS